MRTATSGATSITVASAGPVSFPAPTAASESLMVTAWGKSRSLGVALPHEVTTNQSKHPTPQRSIVDARELGCMGCSFYPVRAGRLLKTSRGGLSGSKFIQ